MIPDSFINGLCCAIFRQRLLENKDRARDLASSLDCALEQSTKYVNPATAAVTQCWYLIVLQRGI